MYIIHLYKLGEQFNINVDGCEAAWACYTKLAAMFGDEFGIALIDAETCEVIADTIDDD